LLAFYEEFSMLRQPRAWNSCHPPDFEAKKEDQTSIIMDIPRTLEVN
jgi:hypothetical protein